MKNNKNVAQRIKSLRNKKDMLQRQIAKAIGVSLTNYKNWEGAKYKPDSENIVILAKFHGVSPSYIINGSPKEKNNLKLS